MPQLAANWNDILEKHFSKIYFDQYPMLPVMVPDIFKVLRSDAAFEKSSQAGIIPDHAEFTGSVTEVSPAQGYDKSHTFTEYAAKIEVQRKLASDDFLKMVVDKFDYMRELSKTLFTFKVKIKEIAQWIIRRKDLLNMELRWVG